MKRAQKLKNLLLSNSYQAPNLQAESSRLEQIEIWLQELEQLLKVSRTEAVDWVFADEETA